MCSELNVDLGTYDISQLEPLHDLKSMIGKLLKELCYYNRMIKVVFNNYSQQALHSERSLKTDMCIMHQFVLWKFLDASNA